jgi:hypothetical protein
VNDIEGTAQRPPSLRAWQRWNGHDWLRRHSYLYFFFNHKAAQFLPPPGRSYVDYILQTFVPGTSDWAEFERSFHAFAMKAAEVAPRRLLVLYPQVPFSGRYPLQDLHDRLKVLAGPHTLVIPPSLWLRSTGGLVADATAPWRQVVRVAAGVSGHVIETPEYVVRPGSMTLELTIAGTRESQTPSAVGVVQVIDATSNEPVAAHAVDLQRGDGVYETLAIPLTVPGDRSRRVRFRLTASGRGAWAVASVGMSVDYRFEVLDLAEPLNQFNTHASIFDAHPNEAAHRVIAEQVHRVLLSGRVQ